MPTYAETDFVIAEDDRIAAVYLLSTSYRQLHPADSASEARARDLYVAYRLWCEEAGEIPMNERDFGSALAEHGFTKRRIGARENKPAGIYWSGVSLTV